VARLGRWRDALPAGESDEADIGAAEMAMERARDAAAAVSGWCLTVVKRRD